MSYKWQGYIDYAFANDIPLVALMEKAYQMGRTDQAKEDDELNYHYATSHDCWLKGRADERNRLHEQIESLEKKKLDLLRYGGDKTLALGYCQAIADVRVLLAEGISE